MVQTVVVGLDGAGFELLGPWIEAGELPNLERIVDRGVSGDLRSELPPVTSPSWKVYSTGRNPGKLGIFWWYNIDTRDKRVYRPSERYHDTPEFWELLAEREPVGVLGMPMTYPPKSVDGFVVSGAPDGGNAEFTQPRELAADLRERFDYRVTTRHRLVDEPDRAYEEMLDLIETRFRAAKYLLDRYDVAFLQVTTFYINVLHHHLWDDERTLAAWRTIDEHLGDFVDMDADLVLMSDHGHAEIETVFRINRWLEREGYLTFDSKLADALHAVGITSDRVNQMLTKVNGVVPRVRIDDRLAELVPRTVVNRLPDSSGGRRVSKIVDSNWDRTEALATAQGGVYLNVSRDSERYDELRRELVGKLERMTDPAGRPVVDAVYRGEDVYSSPYVGEGPDVVVDKRADVHVSDRLGDVPVFATEHEAWRGVNTRDGLFAAVGPGFGTGTVADISILDLAPTLLHLHGRSVPDDLDGRVRHDALSE